MLVSLRMWLTGVVVAALAPAVAPSAEAASNVVVDGHARFEVLSPTLIRLEYAGDDVFQDRPTFNAIGRDMPVPAFTTSVSGGYREIRTAGVTVRYSPGGAAIPGEVIGYGVRVNVTDHYDNVWWHINSPYGGWVLAQYFC
ncbi:hypothetical protein ACFQ1S_28415 [Kibdelosporangium lantanae]|uniref:SH3 domain-containing protein n=1 Tax=Kibdelosporangium lantanae TaxID=1497396 RepID=A0ABW3MJ99_9PSEU